MLVYCWANVADGGPTIKPTVVDHRLFTDILSVMVIYLMCYISHVYQYMIYIVN